MKRFIEGDDRKQITLLPESLDEYISEDNPVRVVDVFVEQLNLGTLGFNVHPAMTGRPSYHPSILHKLYLYGYLNRTRGYDPLDRLTAETTPQGSVAYSWDAAGRRSSMTVAGQPPVSYGYDAADRLVTLTQGASQVGFTYDDANRRATLTLPNGIVASYGYDPANQLTGVSYALGGTSLGDLSYAYDDAGRRIQIGGSLARTHLPATVASASYDAANRLTSWAGATHSYDANGNLTSDGAKTYTWNSRNRLTGLSGGASASFQYDGLGRRTGKTISGTVTNVLYDGLTPVQELTGSTPKANLLTGLGIDEYFTRTDAAGARTLLTDALGSTLALADDTGALQTSYTYAPYGATSQSGAASSSALQYTGRENDGTGLYYYRARYYDPMKSRFAAEDPIGLAAGINQYTYVRGNPLIWVDPLGLANGPAIRWMNPTKFPTVLRPDGLPWGAGCGDASSDCFVPDKLAGGDLMRACQRHDDYYDTEGADREYCDARLGRDIKQTCDIGRAGGACYVASWFYPKAISVQYYLYQALGQPTAFDKAQQNAR